MAPLSETAKQALVARLRCMARSGKRLSEDKLVVPLATCLAGRGLLCEKCRSQAVAGRPLLGTGSPLRFGY